MEQIKMPENYNRVMPYLILKDANAFLEFTKTVFDATEKMKSLNDDGTIMHLEIFIGESVIMIGESGGKWEPMTAGLFIYVANADEIYQKALAAGGSSVRELTDEDYGRTCGVLDPAGNTWWITSVQ